MNESAPRLVTGMIAAVTSVSLSHVASVVSILAGLVAIAATLPVAVDRWRHVLPAWFTRHFPAKPAA